MHERMSLIVYFNRPKVLKQIKRHGNLAYYHKKRRYAVIYVNAEDEQNVVDRLKKIRHVRKVEVSLLDRDMYHIDDCQEEVLDSESEA